MHRPENTECCKCTTPLTADCVAGITDVYVFCLNRAYKCKVQSIKCRNEDCNHWNRFDGWSIHVYNHDSGNLWHHSLMNSWSNAQDLICTTMMSWRRHLQRTYVDNGSPVEVPGRKVFRDTHNSFMELMGYKWEFNCIESCDRGLRAGGTATVCVYVIMLVAIFNIIDM